MISFPAWDCVPYDRVSPNTEIVSRRISALARLVAGKRQGPLIVLTTVNAATQRLAPRDFMRGALKAIAPQQRHDMGELVKRLEAFGYSRTGTVMEAGEYAVRGGILDVFPPGRQQPVRLDFFGDNLETLKPFDAETQRTIAPINRLVLMPISEAALGPSVVSTFRARYIEMFGAVTTDDPLYEAISAGHRYPGMEHWLPLFQKKLETLFDYLPEAVISFDNHASQAIDERFEQIDDHFKARANALEVDAFGAPPYKPLPPKMLYIERAGVGEGGRPAARSPVDPVRRTGRGDEGAMRSLWRPPRP